MVDLVLYAVAVLVVLCDLLGVVLGVVMRVVWPVHAFVWVHFHLYVLLDSLDAVRYLVIAGCLVPSVLRIGLQLRPVLRITNFN